MKTDDFLYPIRRSFASLTDLLLPRECIACGEKLLTHEKHLCLHCSVDLPQTYFWTLSHNPMSDKFNERIQEHIVADPPPHREPYAFAAALFFYHASNGYSRITRLLKYDGDISVGKFFAHKLARHLKKCPWLADVNLVIPVPLHPSRMRRRGYNQAEVIGRVLAEDIGAAVVPEALRRIRNTATQTTLTVEEKARNVDKAFEADAAVLFAAIAALKLGDGERVHILLVDDVFTTGSTMGECWRALRKTLPPPALISAATLAFVGE